MAGSSAPGAFLVTLHNGVLYNFTEPVDDTHLEASPFK